MNSPQMSSTAFREVAMRVIEIAAQYLEQLPGRAIPAQGSGKSIEAQLRRSFPEQGLPDDALEGLREAARFSRAQNGRFFGYVLGSGEPAAAAADLLCSVLNQNVTAWRSSPAAVTVEKEVTGWLAQAIGCTGFGGSLTGGGSAANLMALAMAREAKLAANENGLRQSAPHVVYASTEAHMSIAKAVSLLGIGRDHLRLIPVDESFRILPEALEARIRRDRELGITPIAVVATAGTVNTGAIDPLAEISEIARKNGAWFHVDGAYGALAAIAAPELFRGLDKADSIALDPHKWLYQPLDCGCLLYRNSETATAAFSHSDDYVRSLSQDPIEGHTYFEETIELSRRFRALKLWFSLRYHGFEAFRGAIRRNMNHARRLAELITKTPELELMAPVELSAVCFRYVAKQKSQNDLNRINAEILRNVNARGRVYLSNATLHTKFCLRGCIVNHRTIDSDIEEVIPEVLRAAKELEN